MKKELRRKVLEKRDSLSKREVLSKSKLIKEKLFSIGEFKLAKTICFFVSFNSEIHTHNMIKEAIKQGKDVCVPIATDGHLILSKIKSFKDLDKENIYGILEPSKEDKINKNKVDVIVVPGTVFDKQKHRIGYGQGYYDKLLKKYQGLSVGICFDLQIIGKVPRNEWDEKLDLVISEKRVVK
jgi:5-formyltetrahydrofolate cyclo-ligase